MNVDAVIKIRDLFIQLDRTARAEYIRFLFEHNMILRANKHRFKGLELPDNFWDTVQLLKERLPPEAYESWKFAARNEKRPHVLWDLGFDVLGTPIILSPGALAKALERLVERDGNERHSRWQLEAGELYDSLKGN